MSWKWPINKTFWDAPEKLWWLNEANNGWLKSWDVIKTVGDTAISADSLLKDIITIPKEILNRLERLNWDTIKFMIEAIVKKSFLKGQLLNWKEVNKKFDLSNWDNLEVSLLETVLYWDNFEAFDEYDNKKKEILDTFSMAEN